MMSQVAKWGNSQGVRIPRKLLQIAGIEVNDNVEIFAQNNSLLIKSAEKKNLDWYLESYDSESDRYDWAEDERTETQGDIICEQVRTIDLLVRKCKVIEQLPKDLLERVLEAVSTIIALENT
ncbi:MAG: AbrB/MazE/SpoVT family DNA-binding domain-containing protein [Oscillospiraceae bacterium]|nr:AbrB/MazE/SpoVT family DNA-binding domain-containing protein [Oscillospiraceae bacterium]